MRVSRAKRIQLNKRDREIYRLHTDPKTALTFYELGKRYNLTRQRVGQIVREQEILNDKANNV